VLELDNARLYCRLALKQLVEEAGCFLLFLPPYSPDFNPIEPVRIKNAVRTHAPHKLMNNDKKTSALHWPLAPTGRFWVVQEMRTPLIGTATEDGFFSLCIQRKKQTFRSEAWLSAPMLALMVAPRSDWAPQLFPVAKGHLNAVQDAGLSSDGTWLLSAAA